MNNTLHKISSCYWTSVFNEYKLAQEICNHTKIFKIKLLFQFKKYYASRLIKLITEILYS